MQAIKDYTNDFFKELNEQLSDDKCNDENLCLISKEPLEENFVKLPCSHSFNYKPLYNEICCQKKKNQPLEVVQLKIREIKCPYCRTVINGLLPYRSMNGVFKKYGVNYPAKYSLPLYKCKWKYKTGKNKGKMCLKPTMLTNNLCYCNNHLKLINKKDTIEKCDNILKTGKRKGERCGCKCFKDNKCKRHFNKIE